MRARKAGKLIILSVFCSFVSVKRREERSMKMTEKEYKELIAHFNFLLDKVDPAFQQEAEKVVERLEEEYKQFIVK